MARTKVAVLRGGPSSEYEISLKSGRFVLDNIPQDNYEPLDIYIDKSGLWHRDGVPQSPDKAILGSDVVFNALHGEFGEDGQVQRLLDTWKIPYTGSDPFASALGMNKILSKQHVSGLGVKTPVHKIVTISPNLDLELYEIFRSFPQPSVVKPYNGGSSKGTFIVSGFNDLKSAVAKAFEFAPKVIIEEYIAGKEATCAVVDNFRGEKIYSMYPIEITPPSNRNFYDYEAKYSDTDTTYKSPGTFSQIEKEQIMDFAKKIHESMNLRHYSRSDFIISPRRGVYFLEVNTSPGLTEHSLVPKSVEALGLKFSDFLHHVIQLALA